MEILNNIQVPTENLQVENLQKLLILSKEKSNPDLTKEFLERVVISLWDHLDKCLENLDDQLLCSICFYSVLTLVEKKESDVYMEKLQHVLGSESDSPSRYIHKQLPGSKILPFGIEGANNGERNISSSSLKVVSLIYGMFQSSFLTKRNNDTISNLPIILNDIFHLLLQMAYEYSEYTFLVFKILKSFKKVCGGPLEMYIFNKENNLKLLAVINNNWENPITGVRDMNRCIFQTVISTLDIPAYGSVLKDINGFYWNKAKYLMLSDIIEYKIDNILSIINHKWIEGVVYSLYKPGLVSAGADMYYALLKKINNQDDWCQFFLGSVLNILSGCSIKAIDNFCNYWCLTTIKKFRTVSNVLIEELEKLESSEHLLYSKLSILRQANKLGVLDKSWSLMPNNIMDNVLEGLINHNSYVRLHAFDIVCVSQGKNTPTLEYNLILEYLTSNLNSDSTVLRISMLSSLNAFLTYLHSISMNVIVKTENSDSLDEFLNFCKRLQYIIVENILVNGNYQRKITSVKLCWTVLTCFTKNIAKKKKADSSLKQDNINMMEFLKQKDSWILGSPDCVKNLISLLSDPADDVRENVIKILLSYYTKDIQNDRMLTNIMNTAEKCIQSKFFYEIGCGQSMYKLIVNLFINMKGVNKIEDKCIEAIFDFAFNELGSQHAAKTNVMNSIERGQQLHSYMSIMLVILEECHSKNYSLQLFDSGKMCTLIGILENVSNQFVWDDEGSSDFSEMNDMIQNIIETSEYNSLDCDDNTKISGLQQIVLNCLWLNVKASCDLAATLILYNVGDVVMSERCLNIITRVLETSRHKGAIEAAGTALGKAINYLTSLPEEKIIDGNTSSEISKLPYTLLKCKLNDLISETNKMSSVTRRGAGLSIMLHRMVSNDMKKGKPLFHYFIRTLLQKCKYTERSISSFVKSTDQIKCDENDCNIDENIGNQLDLPAAIYIHFMTRIVTDSSLATDVMYYSAELAELAFGNLTSTHWQIRNAALQLYGALIPRLIGQKKASGTGDETISTVACDEMLTHSPLLWKYIIEQLKQNASEDLLQTHSNLVPILNLLANSAKRYHFTLSVTESDQEIVDLFYDLSAFLNSPIYTVRRLTAKAIFNMYEFQYISNFLLNQEKFTENQLHGFLLLLNLCHNYYSSNFYFEGIFRSLGQKYKSIFNSTTHSYLCKNLYEEIFTTDFSVTDLENTMLEWNSNNSPGIHLWAETRFRKYIEKCTWDNVPTMLNLILQNCKYDDSIVTILEILLSKLEKYLNIPTKVLQVIANSLVLFEKRYNYGIIWRILFEISKKTSLDQYLDIENLLNNWKSQMYNLRYIAPLVARHIETASIENKAKILQIITILCDFENSDVVMRHVAAVANNEISHNFKELPDSLKIISIKCAVLLLQDEDEDVRNLSVEFYSNISKEKRLVQPYICLNKILEASFLNTVLNEPLKSIEELKIKLTDILQISHKVDEYNPFANESKNIYFEPHMFKLCLNNL